MKGLEEYIKVHGRHFTEQLALAVTEGKWDGIKVSKAAQRKVYFNVTGSTLGDMVFLTNEAYDPLLYHITLDRCVCYMLMIIGDFLNYRNLFDEWLEDYQMEYGSFDFTPYI